LKIIAISPNLAKKCTTLLLDPFSIQPCFKSIA